MRIDAASYGYTGTLTQELVDFARRQLVNATMYRGDKHDRRQERRHPMMLPVIAVPVDESNRPTGEPFEVITRDISPTSIGILSAEEVTSPRLAIHLQLADTKVNMVISVLWTGALGPFFGAGGRYVSQLSAFPCEVARSNQPSRVAANSV